MYYVDFYAGESYDYQEQESSLGLTEKLENYSTYINSGNCPVNIPVYVRLVGKPTSESIIHDFTVSEVETESIQNVYMPYFSDDKTKLCINTNAKDILYVPKYVKSIPSAEDLYMNVFDYDLDETSYIENFKDMDLAGTDTSVNVREFKNNRISAEVSSKAASFINFSQNYYPGWKAYVNGRQVPVHMVNGLIQGIEVPAGDSTVEFKFQPASIYIGGAISLATLLVLLLYIIWERKNYE
jgi:uncharacterized membrane protein YfhO